MWYNDDVMNGQSKETVLAIEVERQSAFSRSLHSIRTRYAMMTAFFLLLILGVFYIGGRIVLIHLVRDAEAQVKEIGSDLSRIAYKGAESAKRRLVWSADGVRPDVVNGTRTVASLIGGSGGTEISVAIRLNARGVSVGGACCGAGGEVAPITSDQLLPYYETLVAWRAKLVSGSGAEQMPVGIMRLHGVTHYVTLVGLGDEDDGALLVGTPFDSRSFADKMNESLSGMEVKITNRRAEVLPPSSALQNASSSVARNRFGIVPLFSEAANFYSGGFWDLGSTPFEAVFAIRDISGNAVSMIAVSLPRTFRNVTGVAIGRLTFFIAMAGILLVLPIFWFQARVLLNPLTSMTQAVKDLGAHHRDTDCPRLEWEGKDEFALLAASVNRMLETLSARALSVAHMEARHKALIAGLPDALAIFDPVGRLVSISKEAEGVDPLPGFRRGEVPDGRVFGEPEVQEFLRVLGETIRTRVIGHVRLMVQRPEGVSRSVPTRHFELRLTKMDEHFVLAIIRDVSAEVAEHKLRLAAEQRVSDSRKRESLTLLAAGLAHDMNNVLSLVLSAAEAHDADPSGDSRRALGTIREAVRRGSSMMNELMTYAGENKMTFVRMSPKMIMDDVRVLAEQVVSRNVVLTFEPGVEVSDVDADPNQFWKVLFNIIKNANEAIGSQPGHISVSAMPFEMTKNEATNFLSEKPLPEGAGVIFRLDDDGPGVTPEILARLFDPYVSSKSVGRGLGLATVRAIVEAHGGGICVRSKLDHGTSFFIYLPESKLPKSLVPKSASGEGLNVELSGDVLVVDNDEAILKTSSILLKSLKMTARLARDRREALAVVRRHAENLTAILLDANLGRVDTVRLLGAFRIGAPGVPVIVASGSAEEDMKKLFKQHPFDAFLGKPYTIGELKSILAKHRRNCV